MEIGEIRIGDTLTNRQIVEVFRVGNSAGMRRSLANNLLVLTSKKNTAKTQFKTDPIYHDRWSGDVFLYTGEGLVGDQSLDGQNKTAALSGTNGVALHLFETEKPDAYVYSGLVELAGDPFQETQPDKNGNNRQVFIFPLRRKREPSPVFSVVEREIEKAGDFDPTDMVDGRKKVLASIVRRRGQRKFRNNLLEAYGGKCAITSSAVTELLDAAHIIPYKGDNTNDVRNGLLLRTDIHTLFDLGLITVDPETWRVVVAKRLLTSQYAKLEGRKFRLPADKTLYPSVEALRLHRKENMI